MRAVVGGHTHIVEVLLQSAADAGPATLSRVVNATNKVFYCGTIIYSCINKLVQ